MLLAGADALASGQAAKQSLRGGTVRKSVARSVRIAICSPEDRAVRNRSAQASSIVRWRIGTGVTPEVNLRPLRLSGAPVEVGSGCFAVMQTAKRIWRVSEGA